MSKANKPYFMVRYLGLAASVVQNYLSTNLQLYFRWNFFLVRRLFGFKVPDIPVIISLTSYPPRYKFLSKTLKTLISQSVQVNAILVYVYEEEFDSLPNSVTSLVKYGVKFIAYPRDLKSYLKLIPVSEVMTSNFIATADDDISYPSDWLAKLYSASLSSEGAIIGHRGFKVELESADVHSWKPIAGFEESTTDIFLTGVGGIMYPSWILEKMKPYFERVIEEAPSADDIGLFFIEKFLEIPRVSLEDGYSNPRYWPNSQDIALWRTNVSKGENSESYKRCEKIKFSL